MSLSDPVVFVSIIVVRIALGKLLVGASLEGLGVRVVHHDHGVGSRGHLRHCDLKRRKAAKLSLRANRGILVRSCQIPGDRDREGRWSGADRVVMCRTDVRSGRHHEPLARRPSAK